MVNQKNVIWVVVGIVVIIGIFLFTGNSSNIGISDTEANNIDNIDNLPSINIDWSSDERNALWRTTELKDISSQQTFKINDFFMFFINLFEVKK